MSDVRVVMTTFNEENLAKSVVRELLNRRLIACANIVPGATSLYQWEGEVCEEIEVLVFLKTTSVNYSSLEAALQELHPYDVPEIMAFNVSEGSESYLNFVRDNTG